MLNCHNIYLPDRFRRFDVYWIQKNRQTPRQTSKVYIDILKKDQNERRDLVSRHIELDLAEKCFYFIALFIFYLTIRNVRYLTKKT